MKFDVQHTQKHEARCVFTGFLFAYDGYCYAGDLFMSKHTPHLCIHGINKGRMKLPERELSEFRGVIADGENGYNITVVGTLDITERDLEYAKRNYKHLETIAKGA